MADLKDRAIGSLVQTSSGNYFMPEEKVLEILTDSAIEECIRESGLRGQWAKDCTDAVRVGGRKILIVLIRLEKVSLLSKFVEKDRAQDSKLPFELEQLQKILESDGVAFDFYQNQWSTIPAFFGEDRTHRFYHQSTILPFLSPTEPLSEGAFGEVSIVTLAGTQHGIRALRRDGGNVRVVRKSLKVEKVEKAEKSGKEDKAEKGEKADGSPLRTKRESKYKNEDRILTLLRSLRHDNIVRLLASYTIEKDIPDRNFLFPLADATLSQILRSESMTVWTFQFPSDHALFQQLYGLSSAIQSLHDYVSQDEDELELIGCHYDLKPQNILIDQGKLLLADFGLSRLRPENSKSGFKEGVGDYMAPECEPLEDGSFGKGIVSRPSDIWSFGCVILEVLTYHTGGYQSTTKFSELRRKHNSHELVFGRYRAPKFHCIGDNSRAISEWLDYLQVKFPHIARFRPLIETMLLIKPKLRPKAKAVTSSLFFQAQQTLYEAACKAFESLYKSSSSLELKIEQERFLLWGWGSKLLQQNDEHGLPKSIGVTHNWMEKSPKQFNDISKYLFLIHDELQNLEVVLKSKEYKAWPVYMKVQEFIDKLWEIQKLGENKTSGGQPLTEIMGSLLETRMLCSDDQKLLKKTWMKLDSNRSYTNIARLAALKFMTVELESDKKDNIGKLLFKDEKIDTHVLRGFHNFGTFPKSKKEKERVVLVEYMSYLSGQKEEHWGALQRRAKKLATLLSGQLPDGDRGDMPNGFRVLKCLGYFHNPHKSSLGLMYDFPKKVPNDVMPLTLKEIIRGFERPELGALFKLVSTLVRCISSFHKAGWLHKNISAHNVIFFDSQLAKLLPQYIKDAQERGRSIAPAATESTPEPSPIRAIENAKPPSTPWRKLLMGAQKKSKYRNQSPSPSPSPSASRSTLSLPVINQPSEEVTSRTSLLGVNERNATIESEDALENPYLVGFNHTREDETAAFTTEASRDPTQQLYQHPDYIGKRPNQRFCPQYDWYSIGIVLLEIGLWQAAEDLAPKLIAKAARSHWLSQSVPMLSLVMGKTYRDAVKLCLECSIGEENRFEELVVRKLERCYA